ncbi:UvrD-helicase domain-containing protein [Alcaligenes endophyticus]|uniref:ATP-dependent DNA helicase Rep n=2 Tax=Alcaligenes endophyticus TaxID=1929088 RepID=A0ABT8EG51_9BURK|nr:UvrD-helicase domain-containing protein [Alcaligenes endophyticus]MCX5590066.1 UvrD-helicase domain-containing protein [Alcaligenes endophyticus]MDN4120271.1 UvrD-helicase domain-containing protein [Alcaligenes endophyticus]
MNAMQRQAVLYMDGPCLVLAGAGSGKTRVITQKIAYLIRECAYQARHIVALTFTNKAAREMNERIRALVEPRLLRGLTVSTFHSLGLRILREECALVGLKPSFSLLDANDALAIIQELLATTDKARLRAVQQEISLWKNALIEPEQAEKLAMTPSQIEAAHVYRSYAATLVAYQSVDFDDLIRLPALLLEQHPPARERWQRRVLYLLVDEYQDTNQCQYRLLQHLVGERAMFTAVGDDDQAIYAWRGATVENLAKLTEDYPSLKLIKLEQNYRSVQRILHAANNVIAHNPVVFGKKLWSDLGAGEAIQVLPMDDEQSEAEGVAIRLSAERFERQAQWRDFAVLYRGNHQAKVFEQALRNLRIPYTISGGQSFFDKAEVRDILAYLRVVANAEDDPAFIRAITTPRRGVGQSTLAVLGQFAAERQLSLFAATQYIGSTQLLAERQLEPLLTFAHFIERLQQRADRVSSDHPDYDSAASELLDELLRAIEYERYLYEMFDERPAQVRWEHVLELVTWLRRKADEEQLSLNELVQRVALITMLERNEEEDPDAVKLSTLHASKGLEYPHVFLVGVEEGLLPHIGRDDEDIDPEKEEEIRIQRIQEERRLMYVGITRAQRSLRLTWCKKRRRARENLVRERSRFIDEMALEDRRTQALPQDPSLSPKQRLDMLKNLLKKPSAQ